MKPKIAHILFSMKKYDNASDLLPPSLGYSIFKPKDIANFFEKGFYELFSPNYLQIFLVITSHKLIEIQGIFRVFSIINDAAETAIGLTQKYLGQEKSK